MMIFAPIIDPTIKYCAVPSGDITAAVQSSGGAAQYLIGTSIKKHLLPTMNNVVGAAISRPPFANTTISTIKH